MSYFSDLEGLRLAVDMERQGAAFYRQAHDGAHDPEQKMLFGFLMREELNHAAKFEAMYSELKANKSAGDEEYFFDADVSRYLQALVETQVFPRDNPFAAEPEMANGVLRTGWQDQIPGQSSSVVLKAKGILQFALQAEKDSILFYDVMMNNAKFPAAKKVFADLKAEEQTHVEKLQELIRTV